MSVALLAAVAGLVMLGLAVVIFVDALSPGQEPAARPAAAAEIRLQPRPGEPPPKDAAAAAVPGGVPAGPKAAPPAPPDNRRVSIRLREPFELLYPTTDSPFVAVTQNAGERNVTRTIWDLRDGRKTGAVTVDSELYDGLVLSPDGKHLCAQVREEPFLEVWSVADGQRLYRINTQEAEYGICTYDFASPGFLLTIQYGKKDSLMRIWNVATSKCLHRFQEEMPLLLLGVKALSPDRRYLAAVRSKNKGSLMICDLDAGKVTSEWPVPHPRQLGVISYLALTYSQDGKSLHLMYFCGLTPYLATLDASTGRGSTRMINGLGNINNIVFGLTPNMGPMLVGLPDGNVMIAGHMFVDPKSGTVVRKLPQPTFEGDIRRTFGTRWASITGAAGDRKLVVEPFPPP
jgi:hypothetical protein